MLYLKAKRMPKRCYIGDIDHKNRYETVLQLSHMGKDMGWLSHAWHDMRFIHKFLDWCVEYLQPTFCNIKDGIKKIVIDAEKSENEENELFIPIQELLNMLSVLGIEKGVEEVEFRSSAFVFSLRQRNCIDHTHTSFYSHPYEEPMSGIYPYSDALKFWEFDLVNTTIDISSLKKFMHESRVNGCCCS